MAALRIKDMKVGGIYREPMTGYKMRVRMLITGDGGKHHALCYYYNPVSGLFIQDVRFEDWELEEVKQSKRT